MRNESLEVCALCLTSFVELFGKGGRLWISSGDSKRSRRAKLQSEWTATASFSMQVWPVQRRSVSARASLDCVLSLT